MTRQEFIDDITSWCELFDFCNYADYYFDDIYSESEKNEYIEDRLVEMARDASSWQCLLSYLSDIPDDEAYAYRINDYDEFYPLDDYEDFNEYKEEVLEWADDGGYIFDEEEEEDEDEKEEYDYQCGAIDNDDFPVDDNRVFNWALGNVIPNQSVPVKRMDEPTWEPEEETYEEYDYEYEEEDPGPEYDGSDLLRLITDCAKYTT